MYSPASLCAIRLSGEYTQYFTTFDDEEIQVIIAYVTSLLVLTSKNTAVLFYQLVNRTIEAHSAVQSERQVVIW